MAAHPGKILPPDDRAQVVDIVSQLGGFGVAAKRFGIARQTLERACGGLGVHPDSLATIRLGVAAAACLCKPDPSDEDAPSPSLLARRI